MVIDEAPEGFPPNDLPPQDDVFAPDYAPEEIAEIAQKLRKAAGPAGQGHRASSPTSNGGVKAKGRKKAKV